MKTSDNIVSFMKAVDDCRLMNRLSVLAPQVILIEAIMQPAVLSVIFANWFGFNSEKEATIVTLETLLLLPELPLVFLLIR